MAYYDDKIIAAAKSIYLTINDKGQRRYSYQEITNELRIRFKGKVKKLTEKTILNWARSGDWEKDYQLIKSLGQEKAIAATKDKERTMLDAKSDDIAQRRIVSKRIMGKANQLLEMTLDDMIKSGVNEIDLRTLQQIANQREEVIRNLDGMQPPESNIDSKINRLLDLYDNK
jgi:hypothetical protein